MASVFQQEKFIKTFTFVHGKDGLEDDDFEFLRLCSNLDDSPLFKIHALKDMGNDLFKQSLFDPAGECYDKACRLLCHFLKVKDAIDFQAASDLAVSLNLNLAACASKLQAFEAAINFCSMVLYAFPSNIKALYRRGVAHMKLNKLLEARKDLEDAFQVDPKNKDVVRELNVVINLLSINSNGKRSVIEVEERDERGGKKPLTTLETKIDNADSSLGGTVIDNPSSDSCVDAVTDMDTCSSAASSYQYIGNDNNLEMGSVSNDNSMTSTPSDHSMTSTPHKCFQFRKKGTNSSILQINDEMYQNLLNGKEVCFYQGKLLTTLSVRILKPSGGESDFTPSCGSCKRNGRGRRRAQGGRGRRRKDNNKKRIGEDVMEERTIDDRSTPSEDKIAEEIVQDSSCVTNTQNKHCDTAADHVPFIFCSKGQKRRRMTRIGKTTKISTQGKGDESPGYSVGVFDTTSCFFPRVRHVSVSCRRYSPEAFKMKKRKVLCSHRSPADPAMKKPRILLAHLPSLFVCNNDALKLPTVVGSV